jgi:hypothetical protein
VESCSGRAYGECIIIQTKKKDKKKIKEFAFYIEKGSIPSRTAFPQKAGVKGNEERVRSNRHRADVSLELCCNSFPLTPDQRGENAPKMQDIDICS